jgi:hypothetical protein
MPASAGLICILCGEAFQSTFEAPLDDGRPDTLVCANHSDADLRRLGLDDLWGGVDPLRSPSFFRGGTARVLDVWEQGLGTLAVYALLGDGDLLMFMNWGLPYVCFARVPREKRTLLQPLGVEARAREPWDKAMKGGWTVESVVRSGNDVEVSFAKRGVLVFSTETANWRTPGNTRHFLTTTFRPRRFWQKR